MKLIIDIPDEEYNRIKEWEDNITGYQTSLILYRAIRNGTPITEGDLIMFRTLMTEIANKGLPFEEVLLLIDNAPTVDIKDEIAGAYNEGYMCGSREAEKARPQGEYVDISKLRLMTVEECAGHTIEYAMGWKACVEWIKKGGAENDT